MKLKRRARWIVAGWLPVAILCVSLALTHSAAAGIDELSAYAISQDHEYLIARGPGDLYRPSIAGRGLIVWYARGASGLDIFGLRLDADGRALGESFLVAGGPGDQAVPAIASSTDDGSYLVVWHDQGRQDADVYARYLTAQGRLQGAPFVIAAAPGDQLRPAVTYAPAAETFLVVWQDQRRGGAADVYARLVPASPDTTAGQPLLVDEFPVTAAPGGQYIPAVACETRRPRCLVAWQDDRDLDRLYTDIWGRVVRVDRGAPSGAEIQVAVERDYQYSPAVVYNPVSAEYLVVWDDDISARRVSRTGRPRGGKIHLSLDSPYQYKPAVAVGTDGNYLVVWEDLRNWRSRGADIYGQWLSAYARPLGPNFALSADRHNQYAPAIAAGQGIGAEDLLVVWEDNRADDTNLSVYGRWLSRDAGDP